jgi:hypothetical protein
LVLTVNQSADFRHQETLVLGVNLLGALFYRNPLLVPFVLVSIAMDHHRLIELMLAAGVTVRCGMRLASEELASLKV